MITYADLSEDQRQLYLKALIATAKADEALDEEEVSFFKQIAEGVGIDGPTVQLYLQDDAFDLQAIPAMRSPVGALILRDAAAMAVINNDLAEPEEAFILALGRAMQFSEEEVEDFLNWAFMGLQWQLKSSSLLEKFAS
jgi:uncharacterized membrane protein YebE (DUF533 family)